MRVSIFRKEFLIKNNMCGAENDIFLCIVYKATIILISNKYHHWYKFIGTNFIKNKHICFTAKDIEV